MKSKKKNGKRKEKEDATLSTGIKALVIYTFIKIKQIYIRVCIRKTTEDLKQLNSVIANNIMQVKGAEIQPRFPYGIRNASMMSLHS